MKAFFTFVLNSGAGRSELIFYSLFLLKEKGVIAV